MFGNITKYTGDELYETWSQSYYSQEETMPQPMQTTALPQPEIAPMGKEVKTTKWGDAFNQRGEAWTPVINSMTQQWKSLGHQQNKTSQVKQNEKLLPAVPAKKALSGEAFNQRGEAWGPVIANMIANLKQRISGNLQAQPVAFEAPKTTTTVQPQKEPGKRKVCIIPGGTGHLGREYTLEYLKQGYEVVVMTRNAKNCEAEGNLSYFQATLEQQSNPEFWKEMVGQYRDAETVEMVNTLGIPCAQAGMSLKAVNVKPAVAMSAALKELEDEGKMKHLKFVHLSSIGAVLLKNDDYAYSKKEAEEEILKYHPKNTCIIRVGYAFQQAVEGEVTKIDNTHAYGPEQLASLIVQPILGSGEQRLQPVFTGDIVQAGMNFREGVVVVNAVGRETLTQSNFVEYFCELANKPCRKVHVPYLLAEPMAKAFPMGHFAPYAVLACKQMENEDLLLDPTEFEKLIGNQTKTLNDVYGNLKGKKLYYVQPPIKQHAKEALNTVSKKMTPTPETIEILKQYGMMPNDSL